MLHVHDALGLSELSAGWDCNSLESTVRNQSANQSDSCLVESHYVTWLVLGDGDLSHSVQLAEELQHAWQFKDNKRNHRETNKKFRAINLIASVLEDQETHHRVYQRSRENTAKILQLNHKMDDDDRQEEGKRTLTYDVLFGVDATQLENRFQHNSLDRIIFNFPHWRGKANNRMNRKLLDEFLRSASKMIRINKDDYTSGEIHIALCDRQGGAEAATLQEWKASWMVHMYAAEYGLVLRRLETFEPKYKLSSLRGMDRPFRIGNKPLLYVFGWPSSGTLIEPRFQIAVRHELRIILDPVAIKLCSFSEDELVHGDMIPILVQKVTPHGIRSIIPIRYVVTPEAKTSTSKVASIDFPVLVFWVVYTGQTHALTASRADQIRVNLESLVENDLEGLQLNKKGYRVSKPFPFSLLDHLVKDENSRQEKCQMLKNHE